MRLQLLTTADLPHPELQAARLDGELFGVGPGYSPIDEIDGPRLRARALEGLVDARLVAERATAAWIWGAGALPVHPGFCMTDGVRVRVPQGFSVREVVLDEGDAAPLGGLLVTTPERTVLDLARADRADEVDERVLGELVRVRGVDLARCLARLAARPNLPHRRVAEERLRRLQRAGEEADQPALTR